MPDTRMISTENGIVRIWLGQLLTLNIKAPKYCSVPAGSKVEIYSWHYDDPDVVGIVAVDPEYHNQWGDLDGEVDEGAGWWLGAKELIAISDLSGTVGRMIIKESHKFKSTELKGLECQVLANVDRTKLVFVEFEQDIGGCSADGLGRRGHCITVPRKILKPVEKTATKEK